MAAPDDGASCNFVLQLLLADAVRVINLLFFYRTTKGNEGFVP